MELWEVHSSNRGQQSPFLAFDSAQDLPLTLWNQCLIHGDGTDDSKWDERDMKRKLENHMSYMPWTYNKTGNNNVLITYDVLSVTW